MYFPRPAINENDLAIIERGDTASHSIEAGQYVSWKGKLGKANSAILQGATLDDSLFDYETDGVINSLNKIVNGVRIYLAKNSITVATGYNALVLARTINIDPNSCAEFGIRGGYGALNVGGGTITCANSGTTYTFTDHGLGGTITLLVIEFKQ